MLVTGVSSMDDARTELLAYMRKAKTDLDREINLCLEHIRELGEGGTLELAKYIALGGKRLRGITILLVSDSLGGDRRRSLKAAVAVELVHASSLAIDDIIDADTTRRGKPASWLVHGVSRTVLVSNMLIPKAQMLVYDLGFNAVKSIIDTWFSITLGEALDVFSDTRDYIRVIDLKTASLFQLSMELGCLAAGREDLVGELREYGLYVGRAYQIADDMVDSAKSIKGGELEKPVIRFLEWLGIKPDPNNVSVREVMRRGSARLIENLVMAEKKAASLGIEPLSTRLKLMPYIVVEKMLEEGGAPPLKSMLGEFIFELEVQ